MVSLEELNFHVRKLPDHLPDFSHPERLINAKSISWKVAVDCQSVACETAFVRCQCDQHLGLAGLRVCGIAFAGRIQS